MIRQLEPEDIAQILTLKDNCFEKVFSCEKGEFVQCLMNNIKNEQVLILGNVENNKLISYCIAVNAIVPPLCNAISILYISDQAIKDKEIKQNIVAWGKNIGAKIVFFRCDDSTILSLMDGNQVGIIGSWDLY